MSAHSLSLMCLGFYLTRKKGKLGLRTFNKSGSCRELAITSYVCACKYTVHGFVKFNSTCATLPV